MGLTVTEDTPADMLAGNMELLVQLPPRSDNDYDDDYEEEEEALHHQHHRNHRDRHHNHHHNNGHHPRRATTNGINARRVTVARSTPMMDLLVQVATSQKLSASSYTLEAIGEHGLVLTHHPNTPIGALDALQVKLLPKQGTFAPVKTRHANQPFEPTFRLQVHLPRNQLYVSRVSSRMNLGKILEEVCREKNLDRSNYELCHPANLEEKLDLSLSLQDYHLQEVTLCPKRRSLGSSLSSQDIMALQRQEERRRQDARHTVFGFAFKKSKESSVSTDSLGERSISPARSDGTGRSASPLQVPTAPPTRPQRKRRPAPKPPIQQEQHPDLDNGAKETGKEREIEKEKIVVISHSRNSSDSSGYHEASVLSDNLDSNIRIPETLPRRSKAQPQPLEPPPRTLAESSQASKSLGNLAFVPTNNRASIARGTSNTSLVSTGLRKKKAAPAPPQPRPLSSAISTQALERIVDSEESLTSGGDSPAAKASSDVAATCRPSLVTSQSLSSDDSEPITVTISKMETENNDVANPPSPEVLKKEETGVVEKPTPKKRSTVVQPFVAIAETGDQFDVAETATEIVTHNVEPARDRKRAPTANDGRNDLTAPITDAEATSELLKKVSDTLSGSSRSPAVALISTSGNVSPKEQQQIKVCVDAPGESKIRINQPQTIADDNLTRRDVTNSSEKSLDEKTIESNVADDPGRTEIEDSLRDSVQNESLAAAETTDWEYQLPEPPTAFRDTEDNENRKGSSTISLEKRSADVESTDSAVNTDTEISNNATSSTLDEKTKSRKNDEVSATRSPKTSTSVNEAINSDTNFQTRTLDSATLERGRVSRSRPVKPLGDSAARRPSHAVSTPSVAPVDNPLSNFTITTYSRPKPVEILNEIEQRDDELQPGILGRKGSAGQTELFAAVPQQNRRHTATAIFVTKNPSQSSKTYMTLPRNEKSAEPEIPPKKIEPAEGEAMKEIDDQQVQINSDANNTNVSRSNVRISIATKPRPRANTLTDIVLSKNQTFDVINGNETVGSSEEQRKDSAPESYDKSSQSGESILNKQETPDKEKQLQSLEILKSILPQLDDARKTSRDDGMSENTDSVTSKETRSQNDVKNEPPTDENPKNSVPATVENTKPSEPKMKRYTYSGPPAIDLGSWSERSRTKVQIKPDSDYKFEKSKSPEIITPAQTTPAPIIRESPSNAGPKIGTTSVIIQNETPTPVFPVQPVGITAAKNSRFEKDRAAEIDNRDRKESNELAKTLIARTTATGFTRRPVSAVFEPSGVSTLTRLRKKEPEEEKVVGAQGRLHNQTPEKDEIDSTPINFKQLKETFGKEQLTNSQSRPNYGTYGRPKSEYNTSGSAVRRDSNVFLSNGESEKVAPVSNYSTLQRISTIGPARVMSGAENTKVQEKPSSISSQEKRNFVVSTNRLGYNQVSEATGPGGVRRTSWGNLMPVVKGFKVTTLEGEGAATLPNNKDKQPNNYGRVAIGDISNGNYVATHNGLKKTVVQIRGDDFTNGIPKPPPTMPVITGVTLKSTNANNSRPKSIGGRADPRSELLEAIKGFGGTSQLRRVSRRSMNISGIQI